MSRDILKVLGDNVRNARLKRNMSQEELAHRANMHFTYLGRVERGRQNISLLNLYKLVKALRVPINEIFPK